MKYTLFFLFFSLVLSGCSASIKHKTGLRLEKEANYVGAIKYHREAANKGDDEAQNSLGSLYLLGRGVPKNYKLAMQWFLKSAKQNNPKAANNIGYLYFNGYGIKKDYAQARKWYKKAASLGNPLAQKNIKVLDEQINSQLVSFNMNSRGEIVSHNPPANPNPAFNNMSRCQKFEYDNRNNPSITRIFKMSLAQRRAYMKSHPPTGRLTDIDRVVLGCATDYDRNTYLNAMLEKRNEVVIAEAKRRIPASRRNDSMLLFRIQESVRKELFPNKLPSY